MADHQRRPRITFGYSIRINRGSAIPSVLCTTFFPQNAARLASPHCPPIDPSPSAVPIVRYAPLNAAVLLTKIRDISLLYRCPVLFSIAPITVVTDRCLFTCTASLRGFVIQIRLGHSFPSIIRHLLRNEL